MEKLKKGETQTQPHPVIAKPPKAPSPVLPPGLPVPDMASVLHTFADVQGTMIHAIVMVKTKVVRYYLLSIRYAQYCKV